MRHLITLFSGLLLAVTTNAAAQDDYSVVEERIRALAPNVQSIAISETPIEGILMVQIQGDIVYATADGQYLIQGRVMDMETREDLTEAAKAGLRKEVMGSIDSSKQITFAPEKPDYELVVFTDIDCGYCRKLHAQIEEYNANGIAINYMAFPRAGVGSKSYEKFVSVWSAEAQQGALTKAKAGADPDPQQCDNPISEQYQQGMQLGVTGTPALLTDEGNLIPGYVPPAQLRERLDRMAANTASE
jgi:thiol:disulfide interchange protein DsbC